MDFKVGDKIRYVGKGHMSSYGDVVVRGVFEEAGVSSRIWISFEQDGNRDTISIFDLNLWEKVPEFFQVGKTYKPKSGDYTVKILEVYEVDNPETEGDRITAIGRVTRPDLTQYITMYGSWEFKYYTEV
jgi:hypothetical protein